MNKATIADLKQFIAATVSQQSAQLEIRLTNQIELNAAQLEKQLTDKIDNLSLSIAEAIDIGNDTTHEQLDDHEHRIKQLEARAI